MRRYFRLYSTLLKISIAEMTVYRVSFFNYVVSSMIWGSFQFVTIILLTTRVRSVYGWKREEMILLSACYSILWGFFHILFAKNFQRMPQIMDKGRLDTMLLKPVNTQFLLSMRKINIAGSIRLLLGSAAAWYVIHTYHMHVTWIHVIGFSVLMIFGLVLSYSIWFSVLTLTMWYSKLYNLVDLLHSVFGLGRYPPEMFRDSTNMLLTLFIPLSIIAATPTKALLQKVLFGDVFWLIVLSILSLYLCRKFWHLALRSYTSAGG